MKGYVMLGSRPYHPETVVGWRKSLRLLKGIAHTAALVLRDKDAAARIERMLESLDLALKEALEELT